MVLSTLLFNCETWTCYRSHIQVLENFHMTHLRQLLGINWQDKISNARVLMMSNSTGIEAWIIKAQLLWTCHFFRMPFDRLPRRTLYAELSLVQRSLGGQNWSWLQGYLECNLKACDIKTDEMDLHVTDRNAFRNTLSLSLLRLEENRILFGKAQGFKERYVLLSHTGQPAFPCDVCGKMCRSNIGLWSHRSICYK